MYEAMVLQRPPNVLEGVIIRIISELTLGIAPARPKSVTRGICSKVVVVSEHARRASAPNTRPAADPLLLQKVSGDYNMFS